MMLTILTSFALLLLLLQSSPSSRPLTVVVAAAAGVDGARADGHGLLQTADLSTVVVSRRTQTQVGRANAVSVAGLKVLNFGLVQDGLGKSGL